MSDREEEVPELDADAKAFLARHRQTGEPSAEALERVGAKLAAPPPAPGTKPATVTRLPPRRPMFPPEVKAAAAVVILLLGAQAIYLAFRTRTQPTEEKPAEVKVAQDLPQKRDAQLEAVAEAWRAGDFDGARRLASRECSSAACGAISGELAEMLELTRRVDGLTDDERSRLGAFDKKLADGRDSALRRRLENVAPRAAAPEELASAEALFKEASEAKRLKSFETAVVRLEKCIHTVPAFHPCYRLLGSVYASIAVRDQSAHNMELARNAYERFLEVAPQDDEYVPKVRAILDAARDSSDDGPPAELVKDGQSVSLGLGAQKVVRLDLPIRRIAIGDPSTADVKTIGDSRLLLIGLSEGKTTLIVWDSENRRTTVEVQIVDATEPQPNATVDQNTQASDENAGDRAGRLTIRSGESGSVNIGRPISRVALGDSSIAHVKTTGSSEVTIDGRAVGKTTLIVWDSTNKRWTFEIEVVGAAQKSGENVTLVTGGYTVVSLEQDISRVALGDQRIAEVTVYGKRDVRIEGLRAGKTTVLVWVAGGRKTFTVEVKESNNAEDKVQDLLVRATMAKGSRDYVGSKLLLLQLLRIDPQNEAATRMLAELRSQARDLYLRAYQLKESSPDEALRLFRQVVELTPPDDETHQKAKVRIAELSEGDGR